MFNFRSFFKKKTTKVDLSMTELCSDETLQIAVNLDPVGKDFLAIQLDRDIEGKSRGWNPLPFTLFQLLELERLLKRKPVGNAVFYVLYTHQERRELAAYVAHNLVKVRDIEDTKKVVAYDRLLSGMLEYGSLIKFPL